MSSSGASSGKSVLPLAYRLLDPQWRQQGIRANKHAPAEKHSLQNQYAVIGTQ